MSKRTLGVVAGMAAAAAMTGAAFATVPSVQSPAIVTTVTPALTIPIRDMPRTDIPGIMRRIAGNRHLTRQQLAQLQQKLLRWRQINKNTSGKRAVPAKTLTPVGDQRPVKYRELQTQVRPGPNDFTSGVTFPGLGISDTPPDNVACAPPDTDAAVGNGYVVEIVNTCGLSPGVGVFKVWDTAGNVVQGATSLGSLWSTSDCQYGGGDNQVSYDQFANRWLMSQFNSTYTGICVAISTSSDPTGSYYLYNVVVDPNAFTDYPKVGVWVTGDANSDAYLLSTNEFPPAACGNCVSYTAMQRSAMLTGSTATIITFIGPPYTSGLDFSALPSEVDGMTMPPLDDPGMFVDYISPYYYGGSTYALEIWQMTPDFGTPANSTLTGPTQIVVDPFDDGDYGCAPQPSPGECLPVLGDRLMYRLAYRNGDASTSDQILVVNHAVTTNGFNAPIGIDWYQLDAPSGSTNAADWAIQQQGVFAPTDGSSRFMGSIAMDHMGNIGLGYTLSSSSIDPSVAVTGQNVGGPSGTMDAGESTLIAGTGVQTSTGRWGDYSSMMVDPSDDCTFWTAQEYISSTGSFHWSTGLGSFKFSGCSNESLGTLAGTVYLNGSPIPGVQVTLSPGGASGTTNDAGFYSLVAAPGVYTATACAGSACQSVMVTIVANQTTIQNFYLTSPPPATISGHVYDAGHLYALFAEITVKHNGTTVADVWTNPVSGRYSVTLPTGMTYEITATAYLSGFNQGSKSLTLTGDTTENFGLTPDASCAAPGYSLAAALSQDFNGNIFPPDGWTVTNDVPGSTVVWKLSSQWGDGNYTGGTGTSADADSNLGDPGPYDTSLVTPPIDVAGLGGITTLTWRESFIVYSGNEALDLDISLDGGSTWTTVQSMQACGTLYGLPGCNMSVDIGSFLPPSGTFQLRWRYYDLVSGLDWYAEVDDVQLGAECTAIPGQLIDAVALDASTHRPLTGVMVSDENGGSWTTATNPSGIPAAVFFEPVGVHTLTASKNNYQDSVRNVTIGSGAHLVKLVLFSMQSARPAATVGE